MSSQQLDMILGTIENKAEKVNWDQIYTQDLEYLDRRIRLYSYQENIIFSKKDCHPK